MSRDELRSDPCPYCGGTGGTIDHVEPRARGGADDARNRVGACRTCNNLKADTPLLVFLVRRGFPVQLRPYEHYRVSRRKSRKIAEAFRRLERVEAAIRESVIARAA